MEYTLGIDIGTFESKGVLVDRNGRVIASLAQPHEMIVPQPGWAEHRAEQDWWHDFKMISRGLLAKSGIDPADIKCVACSAIGPCMLPVDQEGEPLMNAVLYGVDGRAVKDVDELTAIFIITITEKPVNDARLWYAQWLFPDVHASMAGLATSGTLTHWFRDQFARELARDEAFSALASEAEALPPGAKGLLALPYFSGERTPIHNPDAVGCFFGLNLTHQRGDMFRAVVEGIAFGTYHVLQTYDELGQDPRRFLAVGGGTKNQTWLQATSDICGKDQILCQNTSGASFGNAFLAALAIGSVKPEDITRWNPVRAKVCAQNHPVYDAQYQLFRSLYEQTKDIASALGNNI